MSADRYDLDRVNGAPWPWDPVPPRPTPHRALTRRQLWCIRLRRRLHLIK